MSQITKLKDKRNLRILVIKLRAIGDVLLSTIVLNNLRAFFPEARIDFLTELPSRDIVEGHPALDHVIIFNPGRDNALKFFWELNRRRYDVVFDLFCNPRSAQMTFATRAPYRIGYPFRGRAYAYTIKVQARAESIHNTQFNLDALRAVEIPIVDERIVIPHDPEAIQWAKEYMAEVRLNNTPVIALNPSGTWPTKRWGLEHFAQLGDILIEKYGACVLLLWGPGEEADVRTIAATMRHGAQIIPKTTLKQLAALLAECDYFISNDSGPMHIGAVAGVPVLGIFGPTNPYSQGPYSARSAWIRNEGLECLSCNLTACPIGNVCMTELSASSVADAFDRLMISLAEQDVRS